MDRKDTYTINLLSLKEGLNEFDYKIGDGFFGSEDSGSVLGADVDVHLDLTRRNESYRLEFSFDGELRAACDRCLEAVPIEIAEDYTLIVRHGEDFESTETSEGDELLVIPEDSTTLDVASVIRDTLLLSIPMRCVHAEGECNEEMAAKLAEHRGS